MPNTESKSTSDNEQTQAPQSYPHIPTYGQQIEDDSINLYELWTTLWDKKWLVIAVTAISALGSVVYALLQPFVYKAEALLLLPKAHDIQALTVQALSPQGAIETTAEIVYTAFKNNLSSRRLQKKFIEKYGLMDILAPDRTPETRDIEILEGFSTLIKVENAVNKHIGSIEYGVGMSVSTESNNPDFAAKLVNDFISFFDLETIRELSANTRNLITRQVQDIEHTISTKQQMEKLRREDQIKEIKDSISSKREKEKKHREDGIMEIEYTIKNKRAMAKKRREDKIELYEEAAVIASKLGFREKVDITNVVQNNDLSTVNAINTPLYYRGFRALRAEIEFLKSRKSDDPFIKGLRDLQEKLNKLRFRKSDDPFIFGLRELQVQLDFLHSKKTDYTFFPGLRGLQEKLTLLRSIRIEEEGLHAVSIDQPAYPPKFRIRPNRRQITFVGTLVGLFFGIFLAFFVSFMQRQKAIHSA